MRDDTRAANTMAGPATQAGHTVIIDAETQAGPTDFAWSSEGYTVPDVPYAGSDDTATPPAHVFGQRRPMPPAMLALFGGVLACSAALGGYVVVTHHYRESASTVAPTPSIVTTEPEPSWSFTPEPSVSPSAAPTTTTVTVPGTVPPTALPAPSTVPPSATALPPTRPSVDDMYIASLKNFQINVTSREGAIANAHLVCGNLATGMSVPDAVAWTKSANSGLTDMGAVDVVKLAITYYCPQYHH